MEAEQQFVAVVSRHLPDRDGGHLDVWRCAYGFQQDGVFVVRFDRVVVEILFRERLSSVVERELVVQRLLERPLCLSWWKAPASASAACEGLRLVESHAHVLYAAVVPTSIKTCVMEALAGWAR